MLFEFRLLRSLKPCLVKPKRRNPEVYTSTSLLDSLAVEVSESRPFSSNRPFSKMAAENFNKSKLKTNNSTRKSIINLVTLPRFSISGEISAEKM